MLLCIVPEEPGLGSESLLGAWRHLTQAALSLWDWSGEGRNLPPPTAYPGLEFLMQLCPGSVASIPFLLG